MTTASDLTSLNGHLAAAATAIASAQSDAANIAVDVAPPPPAPLSISTPTLPGATVGVAYSAQLVGSGGLGSYGWSATGLPAGLALSNATGAITGTPTTQGTDSVVVTLKDTNGDTPAVTTYSLVVAPGAAPPPPPPTTLLQGAYCGPGSAGVSAVKAFAASVNKTFQLLSTYCDGTSPASEQQGDWDFSAYNNCGLRVVIGLNVYFGNGNQKADLGIGAAGGYNANYKTLAQNLINNGQANAILRIGWEEDVNIFSNDDLTSAQNYAKFFQQIRQTMSAVPGAKFVYSWYYPSSFDTNTINACYPGDAFADCVELDPYDQSWTGSCGVPYNGSNFTPAQSQCVWNNDIMKRLSAQAAFASAHGKPLAFGEWGVINRGDGHGGGDDPTFMTNMLAWIESHNFEWISYFNANSGGNSILSDYPNSLAVYKASSI